MLHCYGFSCIALLAVFVINTSLQLCGQACTVRLSRRMADWLSRIRRAWLSGKGLKLLQPHQPGSTCSTTVLPAGKQDAGAEGLPLPARAASKPAREGQVCVLHASPLSLVLAWAVVGIPQKSLAIASVGSTICNLCQSRRCTNHTQTAHFQSSGLASSKSAQASAGPCKQSFKRFMWVKLQGRARFTPSQSVCFAVFPSMVGSTQGVFCHLVESCCRA